MDKVRVRDGELAVGQLFWTAAEWHRPLVCERVVTDPRTDLDGMVRVISGNSMWPPYDCWTDRRACMVAVRKDLLREQADCHKRWEAIFAQLAALDAELAGATRGQPEGPCVITEDDGEAA
jgi:hypothetical protein